MKSTKARLNKHTRVRGKKLKKCKQTRKVMFRDNIAALLVAATRQRKDNPRHTKVEQRAYRCKFCKQWHLTSKPFIRKGK